jgi:hypothetical protein
MSQNPHTERIRLADIETQVFNGPLNDHTAQCQRVPFLDSAYRLRRRRHLSPNTALGTNRSTATRATIILEGALLIQKAATIPWPALILSRRSLVAATRKRFQQYLHLSVATALSQGREVTRALIMATTRRDNKTTILSGSADHKLTPLTGKRLCVPLRLFLVSRSVLMYDSRR